MESYRYLLDGADSAQYESIRPLTRRIEMPAGRWGAGCRTAAVMACFNIVQESEFWIIYRKLCYRKLMFSLRAGLETDISELKKSGRNSFVIAVIENFFGSADCRLQCRHPSSSRSLQHFFCRTCLSASFDGNLRQYLSGNAEGDGKLSTPKRHANF